MNLPIRFPREADQIYAQAVAYRRLAPTDRLLVLVDLIASGMTLLEQSPHRETSLQLQQIQEAQWQTAQKELLARHAN